MILDAFNVVGNVVQLGKPLVSCNTCPFVVGSESFAGWEGQYNSLYAKALENDMGMVLVNSNAAKRLIFKDELRYEAKQVIKSLQLRYDLFLLSGDKNHNVKKIAEENDFIILSVKVPRI